MGHIGVLLDSDVLIDHLRGKEEATSRIKALEDEGKALCTTTINSFELYYGAYKSQKRERNVKAVDEMLRRLILLSLDGPSSKAAAGILEGLESKGVHIDFRDALVAGVAVSNEMWLLTNNRKRFEEVEGIELR